MKPACLSLALSVALLATAAPARADDDTETMLRTFNADGMLRNALQQNVPKDDPLAQKMLADHFDDDELVRRMGRALEALVTAEDRERFRTFAATDGGRRFATDVPLIDPELNLPAYALPATVAADFEAYRADGAFDRYRVAVRSPAVRAAFAAYMAELTCATARADFPDRVEKACGLVAAAAPDADADVADAAALDDTRVDADAAAAPAAVTASEYEREAAAARAAETPTGGDLEQPPGLETDD